MPILRRPFIDPTYDPKTRTFTADVVWWPARADGDRLWRYTMGFSADFEYVLFGAVQCRHTHGVPVIATTMETEGLLQYANMRLPRFCVLWHAGDGVARYIESGAVTSYRDAAEDADGT